MEDTLDPSIILIPKWNEETTRAYTCISIQYSV